MTQWYDVWMHLLDLLPMLSIQLRLEYVGLEYSSYYSS